MTIGEVGRQSGLAPSAIRFYEKAGLLRTPFRKSGRRAYTPDVVHQLALIRFAKDVGFTLPQIRLLLHGFPQNTTASTRWRTLARGKIKELDEVIGKAQAMKTLLESMVSSANAGLWKTARGAWPRAAKQSDYLVQAKAGPLYRPRSKSKQPKTKSWRARMAPRARHWQVLCRADQQTLQLKPIKLSCADAAWLPSRANPCP